MIRTPDRSSDDGFESPDHRGSGRWRKSTTVRALVKAIPWSAQIDAEDIGEVNPWQMDDAYLRMLWKNVTDLTRNFWSAGYPTVIAGSFASNIDHTERSAPY